MLLFDPGIDVHAEFLRGLESVLASEPLWSDLAITACPGGDEAEAACLPSALEAPDLVGTVGSRLFRRFSTRTGDYPVLAALIPVAAFDEVLSGTEQSRRQRFAAVTLEQPAERQLQLATLVMDDLERVGMVVSAERAERIRNLFPEKPGTGPAIVIESVGDPDETALAFERVMDERRAAGAARSAPAESQQHQVAALHGAQPQPPRVRLFSSRDPGRCTGVCILHTAAGGTATGTHATRLVP